MKINFKALAPFVAVLGTVFGFVQQHPEVVATLPEKLGAGVVAASTVWMAFSKPVHKKDE